MFPFSVSKTFCINQMSSLFSKVQSKSKELCADNLLGRWSWGIRARKGSRWMKQEKPIQECVTEFFTASATRAQSQWELLRTKLLLKLSTRGKPYHLLLFSHQLTVALGGINSSSFLPHFRAAHKSSPRAKSKWITVKSYLETWA